MLGPRLISVFVVLVMLLSNVARNGYAQETADFGDPNFYLIDSLPVANLHASDLQLLDTALQSFHQVEHDSSRIQALMIIVDQMQHPIWIEYQLLQLELIEAELAGTQNSTYKRELQKMLSSAWNNIGYYENEFRQDFSKALDFYKRSIELDTELEDEDNIATTYTNIGVIYEHQGAISEALEYYLKGLKISERIGNIEQQSLSTNNIGALYIKQNDPTKALQYFQRSLRLRMEMGDLQLISQSWSNISSVYYSAGDPACEAADHNVCLLEGAKLALEALEKCKIVDQKSGNQKAYAMSLHNHATILANRCLEPCNSSDDFMCCDKGRLQALRLFQRSLAIRKEINDQNNISISLYSQGKLYLELDSARKARVLATEALALAQELEFVTVIRDAAGLLSELEERAGNFERSYELYRLHIQMRDSLRNLETERAAITLENEYAFQKKELALRAETEKEVALAARDQQRQRLITLLVSLFTVILIGFLIVLYKRFLLTSRQKRLIEEQNAEIEKNAASLLQMEQEKHQLELAFKQRDLDAVNANNLMKLETKKNLMEDLARLRKLDNPATELRSLYAELKNQILLEEKIQTLHNELDVVDSHFLNALAQKFPDLTKTEREICSLIKLNLSIKEIASIRRTSENSIAVYRSRIRSKLGVPPKGNLESFVQELHL